MPKTKKILKRITAAVSAASMISTLAISARAATEQHLIGYLGDLNGDMAVDLTDVSLLSDHLLTQQPLTDAAAAFRADLNCDQRLDARDFTLLKRIVLGQAEPEGLYEEVEVPEPELIEPPIKVVNPTLPSVGETNILMFVVDFPNCKRGNSFTAEEILTRTFGPEDKSDESYPLESIRAYYERASYNRLHMNGDVFLYEAKENIDNYVNYPTVYTDANGNVQEAANYDGTDKLLNEIMYAFDSQIDFKKYDADGNRIIDTILLALPEGAGEDHWWPASGAYYGRRYFDGVKGGNLCFGGWDLNDRAGFNSTWTHELGHAMGLPDYYRYVNYQNTAEDEYGRGLSGDAGWLMMDDAMGDMSAFDKLMYGWYTDAEVQVYTGGTQTFTLQSSEYAPNCLLIPRGDINNYYSEYFIVESITPDVNNAQGTSYQQLFPLFHDSGIRILHCDAEIEYEGWWGPELKWNNYGLNYDDSNTRQRVLRLVNNFGGLFHAGDLINNSVKGFAWYDQSGYQTVDPNISITVDSYQNGTAVVTVAPKG